jgi:hypothetical protein
MTYANENLGPCFGQTQKCGSVKPTNVYQINDLLFNEKFKVPIE